MEFVMSSYVVTLKEATSKQEITVLCVAPTMQDAIRGAKMERMKGVENDEKWFATLAAQVALETA